MGRLGRVISLRGSAQRSVSVSELVLYSLLFCAPDAHADNCTITPLVLPITNVTFPDGVGMNRGIRVLLGDKPSQIQGLRISTILNNTRVRNILDCPSGPNIVACEGQAGSVYSTTTGSFKQVHNLKDWNVGNVDSRPTDGTSVVQGYDSANFTDGPAVIGDFPLEVWANDIVANRSALALGPKSSVLERLVKINSTPSSAFGIDYGSRSEAFPRDGQLVLGGHNVARHSNDNRTKAQFPMWGFAAPVNCPLQVLLADVMLTNDSGNHSLFEDPDWRVTACVDSVQNAFTFTPAMFSKWQKLTDWIEFDGSNYTQQVYPLDHERLMGTITIKLANGYTSVIPHYELVTHERGNDTLGKYTVTNTSRVMAAVNSGQTDLGNNVPVLGGVFLSQNYLFVDYASNSFWLSPQVGNGTAPDDIRTSCKVGNETSGAGDAGGSGDDGKRFSTLGLQIGLPVAFVVVALGVFGYFLYRRGKVETDGRKSVKVAPAPGSHGGGENEVLPVAQEGPSELPIPTIPPSGSNRRRSELS